MSDRLYSRHGRRGKGGLRVGLIVILLVAAWFRLWSLDSADVITDEGLNGFRSLGYIDFFLSEYQKTPYDWLGAADLPVWVKLSFHDHPPLTFIIQHVFLKLGGVNLWSLRLPFALAGIGSVYLVFLIGRELFASVSPRTLVDKADRSDKSDLSDRDGSSDKGYMSDGSEMNNKWPELIGLTAAGLLAINDYHVWISRIGLQESMVIFLNLLTVYWFLRAVSQRNKLGQSVESRDGRYLMLTGLAFGLSLLAKYTSLALLPVFGVYLLLFRRDLFKSPYLYWGGFVALLIFSPVIIYNLQLWRNFGHFDFQFSYFLGQEVADWQFRLGRLQAGSITARIADLLPAVWRGVSPVFGLLSALAITTLLYSSVVKVRKSKSTDSNNTRLTRPIWLLLLVIIFYGLLLLAVGPRERFVAMLMPWLSVAIGYVLVSYLRPVLVNYQQKLARCLFISALLLLFVGYEVYFSYNTALASDRLDGQQGIAYSVLKFESLNWGYNQLEDYMAKEIYADSYPAFRFPTRFKFLEDIKSSAIAKAEQTNKKSKRTLIVYDPAIHSSATAWYIFRPFVYEGWPFISADTYLQVSATEGEDFFDQQGIEETYFIKATKNTLLRLEEEFLNHGDKLAAQLQVSGNQPVKVISHPRVGEVFEIYKF